ncbi:unnamed protein product [Owenia fusiformis]|uniref:TRAF3-interacting protein 1 n=1 Tax=Owenia fusiformis TaxID=6347 RepID=A0A8J1UBS5_OWEFU|nr:unnamed protein product [Owenia fusiformis]
MGDNDLDKVIKKTQETLGKYVKKPPLSDKLLKKPPFRFLHDVFTVVIKNTGFMKGLYKEDESNSDKIKDKDSKVAFLQKTIDFIGMAVGRKLSVKSSKIVAGHEPEKTNELLAALAEAVNKKPDNAALLKKFLGGGESDEKKPPSGSKRDKEKDEERKSSSDKRRREKEDRKSSADRNRSESKDREKKDRESNSREKKDRESSSREKKERESSRDREKKDREKDKERRRRKEKEDEKENKEIEQPMVNGEKEDTERDPPARIPRPSSAKGSRRRHRDDDEDFDKAKEQKRQEENAVTVGEDDLPPQVLAARKLSRPASARPAAPKVKNKDKAMEEQNAPIGSSNVPNLIVDNKDSDEDDDMFVTKEEEPTVGLEPEPETHQVEVDEDGDHGGLVKKILETKKELEGGSQKAQAKKTDRIEKPIVSDAARRKEREMVQREIDKLRTSIQTLTRSANPLGKIMDYVQEDLDSMQKELEVWKKENKDNTRSLQQEQSITESSVEPLKAQLAEIDQAIVDQLDLIAAVKCNIKKNDDKIEKMLSSVTKS